ncbi:BTAD domain-containing putative transcriptional regulator [Kutzneria sp. NPDC052558]|uniref:AfsR/SARP family transcriptional regulator n=1 Tax=Kutzneria sp. NPDC052558 TaxID=3364121 RepID=UPI0037CB9EA4
MIELRVLGPVEAYQDGRQVALGGPKPKNLLVALLLAEGHVVSVERLVDVIWGEQPPASAAALLQTYMSSLRRALARPAGGLLLTKPRGYQLEPSHCTADLIAFTTSLRAGREAATAGEHRVARDHLRAALGNWRGTALGGLTSEFARSEAERLASLRLAAVEELFDAELALGAAVEVVGELTSLVAEHPLRERLRGHLMTVLHRMGQRAEALACYQAGRLLLIDELGLEPGPQLRAVHQRILCEQEERPVATSARRPAVVPHQLPPDTSDFIGRVAEADVILRAATSVVIVTGKPGAGKSALAVHVGHQLTERCPDGQLHLNLRGAGNVPVEPADALFRFLRALGVDEAAVPTGVEDRVALYRTMVADRRLLVVLDDAADERQVRPLLPSGRDCLCLITSRGVLGGLEGARRVDLPTFDEDDGRALLAKIVGDERLAAEPEHARTLVELCGRLPLAVRILGARLAARPDRTLDSMVGRLRDQHRVLNELAIGDLEVRGSLALSYDVLAPAERALLRGLGWLGVPDFAPWLADAVLDDAGQDVDDVMDGLVRAQLLDVAGADEAGATRYRLHDLTRVFAWERANSEDGAAVLGGVAERVARTSLALVELASDTTPMKVLRPAPSRSDPGAIADQVRAKPRAWFDAEQSVLVHVVERASELGLVEVAGRLATALCASCFTADNRFQEWWRTHSAALAAAVRAEDHSTAGVLLVGLGWLRGEQDRHKEAVAYYRRAVIAFDLVADVRGASIARLSLSSSLREQGRLAESCRLLDDLLGLMGELDDLAALARAHHGRGMVLTEIGRLDEALVECERTIAVYRELGDDHGVALATRSAAIAHRAGGRLDEAEAAGTAALTGLRASGDRLMTAYAVQALAKVRIRQGSGDAVRQDLAVALETCRSMQDGFGRALMLRTLGELELAVGRVDVADGHFAQAVSWWEALALPLWRARTQRDMAAAHHLRGRHELAVRAATEAMSVFRAHGSREADEPLLSGLG